MGRKILVIVLAISVVIATCSILLSSVKAATPQIAGEVYDEDENHGNVVAGGPSKFANASAYTPSKDQNPGKEEYDVLWYDGNPCDWEDPPTSPNKYGFLPPWDVDSYWDYTPYETEAIVVLETCCGLHGWTGRNYTSSSNRTLTSATTDYFPGCWLHEIPTPADVHPDIVGAGWANISWVGLNETIEESYGNDGQSDWSCIAHNIANYSVYRSIDNKTFMRVGNSTDQVHMGAVYFNDTGLSEGTYFYKIAVNYRYPINKGNNCQNPSGNVDLHTTIPGLYITEGKSYGSAGIEVKAPPDTHVEPPTNISTKLQNEDYQDVNITWTLSKDDGSGENDIQNYTIYYSESYNSTGAGYDALKELPNGTTYYVHEYAGDEDPNNYFYYVQANDASGNTNWTDQAGKFVREMPSGRQLVSIPLVQSDTALTTVLQTIEGNYSYVQWYNAADAADHWKTYSINKPSGFNDLINVDHQIALWITMISPNNLTVAGKVPKSTIIQLYKGWNFVSYPSFKDRNVSEALNGVPWDQVEGFDETRAPYYLKILASTDIMKAGCGYWVKVAEDCTWMVEN